MKKALLLFIFFSSILLTSISAQSDKKADNLTNLSLYPNPATTYFNISSDDRICLVRMYNIIGKEVKTFRDAEQLNRFDISELSRGLYLVQIVNKSGRIVATRRLNIDTP